MLQDIASLSSISDCIRQGMATLLDCLKDVIDEAGEAAVRIRQLVLRIEETIHGSSTGISETNTHPIESSIGIIGQTGQDDRAMMDLDFLRDFSSPATLEETPWKPFTLPDIETSLFLEL